MAAHPLDTLVVHPGALGDVLQAVPALRALTALGHRLTFAGQPRIGELLEGLGVVRAHTSFDTFGLEALFVEGPPPASLHSRLGQFPRAVARTALTAAGADLARPFLLAHPGAGAPWKRSPASCFARVLERLASAGD